MERQTEFFDQAVANLTPTQIRENLVALAGDAGISKEKLPAIADHLKYKTTANGGNDVTNDIKWFSSSLFAFTCFMLKELNISLFNCA